MKIFDWAEERTQALTIWDIGILKAYCGLFGMILGAYLSTFVKAHVWWFVVPVILLGGSLGYRWFTAKGSLRRE